MVPNATLHCDRLLLGMYNTVHETLEHLGPIRDKIDPKDIPYYENAIKKIGLGDRAVFFAWDTIEQKFVGCCCLDDSEFDAVEILFLYVEKDYRGSKHGGGFTHHLLKNSIHRLDQDGLEKHRSEYIPATTFIAQVRHTNWAMISRLRRYTRNMVAIDGTVVLKGDVGSIDLPDGTVY